MASGTGLLGLDGNWDAELLETLGLDEEQLPELSRRAGGSATAPPPTSAPARSAGSARR